MYRRDHRNGLVQYKITGIRADVVGCSFDDDQTRAQRFRQGGEP